MNRRLSIALGLVVIVAVAIAGALAYRQAADEPPVRPAFSLPDLSGTPRSIDEFDGQVVVLNFWASWCAPCRKEVPMLIQAQNDWGDDGLQIIGLAVDTPDAARTFAEEYGINYPVLADATEGARIQDRYTAPGSPAGVLPYTAVIDRNGRIVARVAGELSRERLAQMVRPLLENGAP